MNLTVNFIYSSLYVCVYLYTLMMTYMCIFLYMDSKLCVWNVCV